MPAKILDETRVLDQSGWVARIRPPTHPWNGRIVLLLHGWTGDENTMWIFARKLPVNCWMVAPRGNLICPDGGYAWAIPLEGKHPGIDLYLEQCKRLIEQIPYWVPGYSRSSRLDIVGFSQGAAMTYVMCLATTVFKAAPLAGYLPQGIENLMGEQDMSKLQLFIAHNTDDRLVSVEESKQAARLFGDQGATVTYCENTGGHKLSAACFNTLDEFLAG